MKILLIFFCEKLRMDEITCEMSPKVSRGLGACRSTLLILNSKTYHPLCHIVSSSSVD